MPDLIPQGADGDFDFLDDPVQQQMATEDYNRFEDDLDDDIPDSVTPAAGTSATASAARSTAATAPRPDATAAAGESTTSESTSTSPAASRATNGVAAPTAPVMDAETSRKIESFDAFHRALQENPTGVVETILDSISPAERARLLGGYVDTPLPQFNTAEYQAQSDLEEALVDRWENIEAIPQINRDVTSLRDELQRVPATMVPQIVQANYASEQALAKLDALCQYLGIELPDADPQKIRELHDGKRTYRDVMRNSVDYGNVVKSRKQQDVQRPETPGNESRRSEPIPEGTDMVTIAERLGYLKR